MIFFIDDILPKIIITLPMIILIKIIIITISIMIIIMLVITTMIIIIVITFIYDCACLLENHNAYVYFILMNLR
jgi:hypothetical protein